MKLFSFFPCKNRHIVLNYICRIAEAHSVVFRGTFCIQQERKLWII